MPETENRFGFEKIEYAATQASRRFASRCVKRYQYDLSGSGYRDHKRPSGFAFSGRLDGQSLAGSGALVFEGELLESPR